MRLTRLALPDGSSPNLFEKAVENLSCSVTRDTQSGYATGARNFMLAEEALGRKFSLPPTDSEMVFLVTFLIDKGLEVSTIKNYLSGIRFYLFTLGIASPPKLPPLAQQILVGAEKGRRNPQEIAEKRSRRAISVEMLKLLEHSIAKNQTWSNYEKNMRWAVILSAWWGAFRIGELLPKTKSSFSPLSCLLASDITFHEGIYYTFKLFAF